MYDVATPLVVGPLLNRPNHDIDSDYRDMM